MKLIAKSKSCRFEDEGSGPVFHGLGPVFHALASKRNEVIM